MDLKFRRNLPLLLLFVVTVAILALGFGDQPIIAYTIAGDGDQSATKTLVEGELLDHVLGIFGLPVANNVEMVAPDNDTAEPLENDSLSAVDPELVVDTESGAPPGYQPDGG